MSNRMDEVGLDTGLQDKDGRPIHLGDMLEFDPNEWGDTTNNKFVVRFEEGELLGLGTVSDWSEWCAVIKRWDTF